MKAYSNNICEVYANNPKRLMDILIDIQSDIGYISKTVVEEIAELLNISEVEIEQTISFYHFFSQEPLGKYAIYLNNSAVANMMGRKEVAAAFEEYAGTKFGTKTKDGLIGLYDTSCIGMNDQEPAAIINNVVFTKLTPMRVEDLIKDIRAGKLVEDMVEKNYGDGNNSSDLIKSMVYNNIRKKGPVLSSDYQVGEALKKIVDMTRDEIIEEVKLSNIRGRGGAGFPTGLKWFFCKNTEADQKYIFCNADEGEPGTFKDRVILTEKPRLIFEGMTIAGYAVGATQGILYLRYEYKYLEKYLEAVLRELRDNGFLGKNICNKKGFDFDIRIQFGAGSYVCGEESALIESAEGKRGEPRDRPPFPVEKGYLQKPTIVNNVETLCSIVKIMLKGALWYKSLGTKESTGTKVLSVSGDCRFPGIYEVEWGFSVKDILEMVGAEKVQAVQVGGPSGSCIPPHEFGRILCYSDLSTGGSLIIIGKDRDLLKDIVLNFTEFFIEESCGSCAPCRILPPLMKQKLENIINGAGVKSDLKELREWGKLMRANRCGLGHTAANPIITTIKNFRKLYKKKMIKEKNYITGFDLEEAMKDSCEAVGRVAKVESK